MYNAIHICGQTRLFDNRAHGCDGSVVVAAKLRNEQLCVLVSDKANVFGLRPIRLGQDDVCTVFSTRANIASTAILYFAARCAQCRPHCKRGPTRAPEAGKRITANTVACNVMIRNPKLGPQVGTPTDDESVAKIHGSFAKCRGNAMAEASRLNRVTRDDGSRNTERNELLVGGTYQTGRG